MSHLSAKNAITKPSQEEIKKFKEKFQKHLNIYGYEGVGEIFNDEKNNRNIHRWIDAPELYSPVWARKDNDELYIVSLKENVTFPNGDPYPGEWHPRKRKEQRKSRKKTRKNRKRRM